MRIKNSSVILCFFFFILTSCLSKKDILPNSILGYKITKKLTGDEAKSFVNKLHNQEVASIKNEIAFYENGSQKAVIYITHYNNEHTAASEENKMTQKISPQNSVFVGGEYLKINKFEVYRCFGMGQTHFVFSLDTKLFWISVDTMDANDFLKLYLSNIQ
jgi:hypothetical protein